MELVKVRQLAALLVRVTSFVSTPKIHSRAGGFAVATGHLYLIIELGYFEIPATGFARSGTNNSPANLRFGDWSGGVVLFRDTIPLQSGVGAIELFSSFSKAVDRSLQLTTL